MMDKIAVHLWSTVPSKIDPTDSADCLSDAIVFKIYQVLVPTLFAIVVLIGTVGNIFVIFVIVSLKKLQTSTNLLLLNLAISDLAFLLICGSFSIVHYVLTEWPLGEELCRIVQYLLYVSCYVTVYTLVAVSAVRYVCVVRGVNSKFIKNKRYIILLIIAIWIVFLISKIPVLLVHGVTYNPQTERLECIISGKIDGQYLFGSFFLFGYALPLVIIASLYIKLVRYLKSNQQQVIDQSEDRKCHVTKVLIILVLTFAVCWLPLHLHLLVAYYGSLPESVIYKILLIVWHSLAFINSMLNPLIYNCFSQDFREGFKSVICKKDPEAECVDL